MSIDGRELVRRWVEEIFNARNLDVCEDVIGPTYIEHARAPFGQDEPGAVPGPEHMKGTVQWLVDQFPDLHFDIEDIVSEDDRVVCRIRSTGTNTGKLNGMMPPTGKTIDSHQTHWFRVEDGRLAEHWATRDDLTAMMQLGVISLTPPG